MENTEKIENIKPAGKEQDIAAILDGCMNEAFASSCIYPKGMSMLSQKSSRTESTQTYSY